MPFDILGDILGFMGTKDTNSANAANVASTNAANAASVANTNETNLQIANNANLQSIINQNSAQAYNTQMSNTSYQRGVQDLAAAGLNPMLAYTRGGASTPTVAAAPVQTAKMEATHYDTPSYSSPYSTLATSTRDGKRLVSEIAKNNASTLNLESDTENKKAEKNNIIATEGLIKAKVGETEQNTATGKAKENEANQNIEASKSDVINRKNKTTSDINLNNSHIGLNTKIGEKEVASAAEIRARENLSRNEAEYGIIAPKIFGGDALRELDKDLIKKGVNTGKRAQVLIEGIENWVDTKRQEAINTRKQK